jgi:hypothetical protein
MRRALIVCVVMVGSMLLGAAPADAGGPTSVLLTNPDLGRATAIYYSDPRYSELDLLLHDSGAPASEPEPILTNDAAYLNVTWLAHDVSIWRTDQLRLDPSGEAWIASDGSDWALLGDGGRVRELVTSLGLVGSGRTPVADSVPQAATEAETVTPPAPVVREETRWFSLTGWRWAVPGLLLGVLVVGLARRRRVEDVEPRRELIDGRTDRVTSPG